MCAFKALVLVFHWWFVICCDLISSCKHVALGQTMWFVQGTLLYEANTHTHTHTHWQGYSLIVSLLMVIANLLYLEPQTTKCSFAKHKLEKEINAGTAIGKVEQDKLTELRKNPQYVSLEDQFVRLHTYASIANLGALAAQAIHLWYLTCKLSDI